MQARKECTMQKKTILLFLATISVAIPGPGQCAEQEDTFDVSYYDRTYGSVGGCIGKIRGEISSQNDWNLARNYLNSNASRLCEGVADSLLAVLTSSYSDYFFSRQLQAANALPRKPNNAIVDSIINSYGSIIENIDDFLSKNQSSSRLDSLRKSVSNIHDQLFERIHLAAKGNGWKIHRNEESCEIELLETKNLATFQRAFYEAAAYDFLNLKSAVQQVEVYGKIRFIPMDAQLSLDKAVVRFRYKLIVYDKFGNVYKATDVMVHDVERADGGFWQYRFEAVSLLSNRRLY